MPYNVPMIDLASFDPVTYPLEPWWFLRPHTIHGVAHTRRVLIHAAALAEPTGLEPFEFEALVHATAWHDIGRTNDDRDPEHGRASVARIADLNLTCDLAPEVLEPMLFAIEWHAVDDRLATEAASASNGGAAGRGAASPATPAPAPDGDPRLRVLWVLKDADGLDRVRIHDLDVTRLRSDAARAREAEARRMWETWPNL
jgi:hypothetical protein